MSDQAELIQKLRALPVEEARALASKMEGDYIRKHIQPEIERKHISDKANEIVEYFEICGSGLDKWIIWTIVGGEECDGCDGDGYLRSNKGTRTDCPDCDGAGCIYGNGAERELITDYDGDVTPTPSAAFLEAL